MDDNFCNEDVFRNGEFVCALGGISKEEANLLCRALTLRSEFYDFDWQYTGGRVCIRQLMRKEIGALENSNKKHWDLQQLQFTKFVDGEPA